MLPVGGQAPALACVIKLADELQAGQIINKTAPFPPGELEDFFPKNGNPFAKELFGQVPAVQDLAVLHIHPAQGGTSVKTGSLIEKPFMIRKALGESRWVMGIAIHNCKGLESLSGRGTGSKQTNQH